MLVGASGSSEHRHCLFVKSITLAFYGERLVTPVYLIIRAKGWHFQFQVHSTGINTRSNIVSETREISAEIRYLQLVLRFLI
jgi:hypothetical protein